jgi:hypothetical protein
LNGLLTKAPLSAILTAAKLAFSVPYEGDGHLVLKGTIDDMNKTRRRFQSHQACAWFINSSGTGKSRTVNELAKKIFTFPFNLVYTNTGVFTPEGAQ